ncbi:RHS repeat-associated core domain-containing protein [Photorhabdus heterorhabditis]|uniref:RHS repeat-associated core domain-containing protein n=1 Tax=Photorhabdus heterorhabditis TaxID=880156 RepID=UPI001FD503B4|nr:RHS repeat-associated core domain-containing protein [Photorhabdus heterorhabditis]
MIRVNRLYFNTYRYYAPEIGRFITPDPLGLTGGINLYTYAPNPMMWIDPWGLTGKPMNSPDVGKWVNKKGGTVWQEMDSKT